MPTASQVMLQRQGRCVTCQKRCRDCAAAERELSSLLLEKLDQERRWRALAEQIIGEQRELIEKKSGAGRDQQCPQARIKESAVLAQRLDLLGAGVQSVRAHVDSAISNRSRRIERLIQAKDSLVSRISALEDTAARDISKALNSLREKDQELKDQSTESQRLRDEVESLRIEIEDCHRREDDAFTQRDSALDAREASMAKSEEAQHSIAELKAALCRESRLRGKDEAELAMWRQSGIAIMNLLGITPPMSQYAQERTDDPDSEAESDALLRAAAADMINKCRKAVENAASYCNTIGENKQELDMLKSQCAKLKSRLQESQLEGKRVRASVMILETEVEQLKGRLLQPARPEVAQAPEGQCSPEKKQAHLSFDHDCRDTIDRPDSAAKWMAKLDQEVRRLQGLVISGKNGLGT